jgi:hypothetical protein
MKHTINLELLANQPGKAEIFLRKEDSAISPAAIRSVLVGMLCFSGSG